MRELAETLDRERELFERLKNSVLKQKMAVIDRDMDSLNERLVEIERLSMEIDALDEKRREIFDDLKVSLGLSPNASLTDLINRLSGPDREILLNSLSKFLHAVNDLAAEVQGMKDMLEFEQTYFEFMKNLIAGGGGGTYSRSGQYKSAGAGGSFDTRW